MAAGCALQYGEDRLGRMPKSEHVGITGARQRQERYWNLRQLRIGDRAFSGLTPPQLELLV